MSERLGQMESFARCGFEFKFAVSNALDGHLGVTKPEHRHLFFTKLGINSHDVVDIGTENGGKIEIATRESAGKLIPHCDGIITAEKKLYLALITADCLPIKLMDPGKGVIGLVHAGWRGLKAGIVKTALSKMNQTFGSDPGNVEVRIAPGICRDHYEIKDDVAEEFSQIPGAVRHQNQKIYLDLIGIAKHQMKESGVLLKNITASGICTYENMDYFSHRRYANPGRFMTILGMKALQ